MIRWTLTLLLAVAVSLEIASVWWTLYWEFPSSTGDRQGQIVVERGAWDFWWQWQENSGAAPRPGFVRVYRADDVGAGPGSGPPPPFTWIRCRFTPLHHGWSMGSASVPLTLPILALAAAAGWLWLVELQRHHRHRIARAGCCPTCGYDLRGLEHVTNKEEEEEGEAAGEEGRRQPRERRRPRCPECGEELAEGERAESAEA